MSAISGPLKNYYTEDPNTHWYSVNLKGIKNKEQAEEISEHCLSDARFQRIKAGANFIMGAGVGLLLFEASFAVYAISALSLSIFTFPLLIIPPLYKLVIVLGGMGASAAFFIITAQKCSKPFLARAKANWNYGNHLYNQAHLAQLHKATLRA